MTPTHAGRSGVPLAPYDVSARISVGGVHRMRSSSCKDTVRDEEINFDNGGSERRGVHGIQLQKPGRHEDLRIWGRTALCV